MARLSTIEIAVNPAVATYDITLPVGCSSYKIRTAGGAITSISDLVENYAGVATAAVPHTTITDQTIISNPAAIQRVIIGTLVTYLVLICES